MSDDEIEDMVLEIIEHHLDEERCKLAVAWLELRVDAYAALKELKLID